MLKPEDENSRPVGNSPRCPPSAWASCGPIDLGWSPIAQGLMGTLFIVEPEVGRQARLQLRHRFIVLDVDVFVFDRPDIRCHSVYAFSAGSLGVPHPDAPSALSTAMEPFASG